jgi:hypothetical protein
MALEHVAHRLVAHGGPEIGQGADDPVVTPGAILLRHAHHQRLQLLVNRGSPWGLPLPRTVELLRHECAMPAENRVVYDLFREFSWSMSGQLPAAWLSRASIPNTRALPSLVRFETFQCYVAFDLKHSNVTLLSTHLFMKAFEQICRPDQ